MIAGMSGAAGGHENSFGFLRLTFASLVIFAHVAEMQSGGPQYEPFHMLGFNLSAGAFAVDGFFVLSGFLITASAMNSQSLQSYFKKRIARIYPAFIVATIACFAIAVPLGGASFANFDVRTILRGVLHVLTLQPPEFDASFKGTHYPVLNGSMWTISYEFRCYILIAAITLLVPARRLKSTLVVLCAALLIASEIVPTGIASAFDSSPTLSGVWFGKLSDGLHLYGTFLVGSVCYVFKDPILARLSVLPLVVAAFLLLCGLVVDPFGRALVSVSMAYVLLFIAYRTRRYLGSINNKNDISYGVYLYAWPVTKVVQWNFPTLPILAVDMIVLIASISLGWLSWLAIERPVVRIVKRTSGFRASEGVKG